MRQPRETGEDRRAAQSLAFRSPGIRLAALILAVAVLGADQLSKSLVLTAHSSGLGSWAVSVRLVRNGCASFGVGAGLPVAVAWCRSRSLLWSS